MRLHEVSPNHTACTVVSEQWALHQTAQKQTNITANYQKI